MGLFREEKRTLQDRADSQLGVINDFLDALTTAKDDAEALYGEAQEEIDKAKKVQNKCNKVTLFVNKILKNVD